MTDAAQGTAVRRLSKDERASALSFAHARLYMGSREWPTLDEMPGICRALMESCDDINERDTSIAELERLRKLHTSRIKVLHRDLKASHARIDILDNRIAELEQMLRVIEAAEKPLSANQLAIVTVKDGKLNIVTDFRAPPK